MMAAVRRALFLVFASCGDAIRPLHYASTAQGSSELRENSLGPRFKTLSEVFGPICLPAVRVDLLSVQEVTFEGSDHRDHQGLEDRRGREDHRDRQDCQDHLDREDHQELPGSPMNVLLSSGSAESLVGMKKVLPGCRKSRRDASTAS